MKLYHRTTTEAAAEILRYGFKDTDGDYLTANTYSGVWLSDIPLGETEGARGEVLFEVWLSLNEQEMAQFEWVEDGKPYREWLVPAALINAEGQISVVPEG